MNQPNGEKNKTNPDGHNKFQQKGPTGVVPRKAFPARIGEETVY